MPTVEFQAIVNSLQSAIFTPGNLVTVSAVTTQANIPVLDLTVNQIDTDSFTIDTSTTPPTLRITAHPEQSPWHSPIDAAGFYLYDLQYIQFADGSVQTTAFNAGAIGQSPWLQDVDAADFDLTNLASLEFSDGSVQSTAYLGAASTQTPWLQQINAAGNTLINVTGVYGKLLDLKPTADHAAYIYDTAGNLAWVFNSSGELSSQHRGISNLSFITFGDLTTQTTAYKGIVATQTPWITNIDAAGHSLSNVVTITANRVSLVQGTGTTEVQPGLVHIIPNGTQQPWVIYNAGGAVQDWVIGTDGNIYTGSARGIRDVGHIRFADATVQTTAFVAGVGAQTPWAQNINGGGFTLTNVSAITATNITTSGGTLFLGNAELTIVPKTGTNALLVYNPGATAADWLIGPAGHLSTNSGKQIFGVAGINFADATVQTTAFKGIPATQTPWLQDINGNKHVLSGASAIIITPDPGTPYVFAAVTGDGSAFNWNIQSDGHLRTDTGRAVVGISSVNFADTTIQTTAYQGVAATQTPWLQNINAGAHSLSNVSGITGSGTILSTKFQTSQGPVWIIPAPGVPAFVVYNNDATLQYWAIDGAGNLASDNGRNITGVGGLSVQTVTTTGICVLGGNLNWSSAPGSGILDTALSRLSAGILRLYGPAGSEGDLYLRGITASGDIVTGTGLYAQNGGQYGAYMQGNGIIVGVNYYSQPSPGGAVALAINASGGFVGPGGVNTVGDITGNVIRAAAIISGPSGDVRSDTFSITSFGTGITGTFTTAGGQTVTVRGGIILSIV